MVQFQKIGLLKYFNTYQFLSDICESKSTVLIDVIAAVRRKDFTNLNCLLQYGVVDTPEDSLESASQIKVK